MSHDLTVPSDFDGKVRLFPLPNVVLFPHVMLPLHIFEPRYRQMTADALATDRLIAMVLLKADPEKQSEEIPAVHSIACLGKIVGEQQLEDGRYNILLHGLSRIQILREVKHKKLYRRARVELLPDTVAPPPEQARAYRQQVTQFITGWIKAVGLASGPMAKLLKSDLPLGALVDLLTFALGLKIELKQELLEELDVGRRARRLLHYLQTGAPEHGPAGLLQKFPPDFSTN